MVLSRAQLWLAALAVTVLPAVAHSQTVTQHWPRDATVMGSLFLGHPDLPRRDRFDDSWYGTGEMAFGLGWHWTPQVKAEFEVSASGEGRQYVQRYITVPNYSQPVYYGSEHYTATRAASAAATWQFFDNEWVHPFVQGGVSVDFDRTRTYTRAQTFYTRDPSTGGTQVVIAEESDEGPRTTAVARALVGAGVKMYVSPRMFVRTDARAVFDRSTTRLSFRAGVGVDF